MNGEEHSQNEGRLHEDRRQVNGEAFDSELVPVLSEADIDDELVYALHTFVATLEGQVCVLKGDSLELLDDSNSYWWLVKTIKTSEVRCCRTSAPSDPAKQQ
eukprot:jgi/Hompol1/5989/HPOL_000154-RA